MNQYHIYEAIGQGKYSTVYKGRKKKSIEYFAIKSVDKAHKSKVLQEIQNQACLQTMDEVEKEYKKVNDRIKESRDAMQASYMELIAESQASTNRVCKTILPELLQSMDKAVDGPRNRYGIAS